MGFKDFQEPTEEEQTAEEAVRRLLTNRQLAEDAENDFRDAIIFAREKGGFTFREIGETLDTSHSWVFKLYKRRKATLARSGRSSDVGRT